MDVIQLFFFFGSEKVVTRNDDKLFGILIGSQHDLKLKTKYRKN